MKVGGALRELELLEGDLSNEVLGPNPAAWSSLSVIVVILLRGRIYLYIIFDSSLINYLLHAHFLFGIFTILCYHSFIGTFDYSRNN